MYQIWDHRSQVAQYRKFKSPFFGGPSYIAGPASCQSPFCLMKILVLLSLAWAASWSLEHKVFQIAPHAQTQSERRRRLALASGFRLSDCLEYIDSPRGRARRGAGGEPA